MSDESPDPAHEALAAIAKLNEGYRFLAVGERIAPEDEVYGDAGSGYAPETGWTTDGLFAGFRVTEHQSGKIRRSLAVEAAWPTRPCDTCRFFEVFDTDWHGECRRHAPPHPTVFRQFWCGDWDDGQAADVEIKLLKEHYAEK